MGPDVASVAIDPRDKIIGHPRWETGKDTIRELDTDPSVCRGEFDGNRWQGRGSNWADCPPERKDCWDRQGIPSCGNPPVCTQCHEETKPEEIHYQSSNTRNPAGCVRNAGTRDHYHRKTGWRKSSSLKNSNKQKTQMLPHLRGWLDQQIDQRKQHMPKSNNRRKKPSQERHKKTTKNTENSQPGYQGINEYREISSMQEQPYPTQSENECRFPELFSTVGCCICGHEDAQECPCGPMETLEVWPESHLPGFALRQTDVLQSIMG